MIPLVSVLFMKQESFRHSTVIAYLSSLIVHNFSNSKHTVEELLNSIVNKIFLCYVRITAVQKLQVMSICDQTDTLLICV